MDVASITDSATVAAISAGEQGVQIKKGTYTPFLTGEVVRNAVVSRNPNTGQIEVNPSMNAEGAKKWADYTTASVGKLVAVVLDGTVQSAPRVNEPILDGSTAILGSFTAETAKQLKTVLETGSLPVTLVFSESRVVGPTLGQDSLRQGVLAIIIGLSLVALYVLLFYRGLRPADRRGSFHVRLALPRDPCPALAAGLLRAYAARHRRHRPHDRSGCRLVDPDPRALQGGGADGQDHPLGRQLGVAPRHVHQYRRGPRDAGLGGGALLRREWSVRGFALTLI